MSNEADRQKIKQILTATIVSLCHNGMNFSSEMTIEGLLGITLDHSDVFLVNIHETVGRNKAAEAQTPFEAASSSRSAISSTVTDSRQHRHQPVSRSLHNNEQSSDPASTAMQPYYSGQVLGGYDEGLSSASGGSSRLVDQRVDWQPPDADGHFVNHGKQSTSNYSSSAAGSQHIKTEPMAAEDCGYDDNSGEVYYASEGYDVKGELGYQYDTGGGYYDQTYSEGSAGDQYAGVDAYAGESNSNAVPAVKRRKVQSAATKKSISAKRCVPSEHKANQGLAAKNAATRDVSNGSSSNSSGGLIERALNLVHEGQLTAGVAIKLFGIPRSTFYKKLSMTNARVQQQQQTDNLYDAGETFGEYLDGSNNEWDTAELNCGSYFVNQ